MVDIIKYQKLSQKPESVIVYNNGKGCIDLSDQKASFSNPLRTTIKW